MARDSAAPLPASTRASHEVIEALLGASVDNVVHQWSAQLSAGQRLETLMTRRLTAKKFRKSPLDPEVAGMVARATAYALQTNRPLRLLVPFGGYKSPSSPEFPLAGWAEAFAAAGLAAVVAPICAFHAPGVIIDFSSDEAVVPRLTGAGRSILDRYREGFDHILALVRTYQRHNLTLRQSFIRDAHDIAELTRRMGALGRVLERDWFPSLPSGQQQRLLRSAAANRFAAGGRVTLNPCQLRRSVCEHQAFLELDNRRRAHVFSEPCTIPVALRRGLQGWLHLGSNHRSATQFWIGFGVIYGSLQQPAAHILPPSRAAALTPVIEYIPTSITDIAGLARLPVVAGSTGWGISSSRT